MALLSNRPVVIDPYDAIVQEAVREMGSELKGVDVIKLESSCPGNKAGWVSNQDLFKGKPGKQRVIHLCLKDIQNNFRKMFGQKYVLTNPQHASDMKKIIKQYLTDVVLPHERAHIEQELEHGGEFGPSAEPKAQQVETWKNLEQMGIKKRAAVIRVVLAYLKSAGM
jgi:hypothetical protein